MSIDYNEIVERQVCANTDGSSGPNCCSWSSTIKVKRCMGTDDPAYNYYVYQVHYNIFIQITKNVKYILILC